MDVFYLVHSNYICNTLITKFTYYRKLMNQISTKLVNDDINNPPINIYLYCKIFLKQLSNKYDKLRFSNIGSKSWINKVNLELINKEDAFIQYCNNSNKIAQVFISYVDKYPVLTGHIEGNYDNDILVIKKINTMTQFERFIFYTSNKAKGMINSNYNISYKDELSKKLNMIAIILEKRIINIAAKLNILINRYPVSEFSTKHLPQLLPSLFLSLKWDDSRFISWNDDQKMRIF